MIRENGVDGRTTLPFLLLLVVTILPAGAAYLLSQGFGDRPVFVLLAVNLLLSLVAAVVLGAIWRGSHLGTYAIVGALAGALHFLVLRMAPGSGLSFIQVFLPDALTVFGGALFGDLVERAIAPGALQPDYAAQLAERILRGRGGAAEPSAVRRLAFIIAVISPVLVLMAAFALAALSYSGGAVSVS